MRASKQASKTSSGIRKPRKKEKKKFAAFGEFRLLPIRCNDACIHYGRSSGFAKRHRFTAASPIPWIEEFGRMLMAAAGRSRQEQAKAGSRIRQEQGSLILLAVLPRWIGFCLHPCSPTTVRFEGRLHSKLGQGEDLSSSAPGHSDKGEQGGWKDVWKDVWER